MLGAHFRAHGYVHLIWMISLLILLIVALLVKTPNGIALYNYISFASAITSLILAVIAIFIAIMSNQSFCEAVGSLRDSSQAIATNSAAMEKATAELTLELDKIGCAIGEVPESVQAMSREIKGKIETIAVREVTSAEAQHLPKPGKVDLTNHSHPLACLYALYSIILSKRCNKSINLNEISEIDGTVRAAIVGSAATFAAFSVAGMRISRVGTSFQTDDIGSVDGDAIVKSLDSQDDKFSKLVKSSIDRHFYGDKEHEAQET